MFGKQASGKRYEVIFSGKLREGFTMGEVMLSADGNGLIAGVLNTSEVARIIDSARAEVLYKGRSKKKALQISEHLEESGLMCKLRKRHEDSTASSEWSTDSTSFMYIAPIAVALTLIYIFFISVF